MSRRLTAIAVILLTVLWGCQKEDTVSIRPKKDFVEQGAGSLFVNVTATGSWSIALEFPQGTEAWATVDPAEGSGNFAGVRLRYQANPSEDPRKVTLVISPVKGASASAAVTQVGKTANPIPGKHPNGYDVAYMDWLELPAMAKGDGKELLIHSMDGGKYVSRSASGVRNWSCYWDYNECLSLWVAYPLNGGLIGGTGSRTNQWGADPLLPIADQPNLWDNSLDSNSYGGGWTRGHQIPSADRLKYAANVSTFVPTNMTPQNYDFNGGIWASLEGKVRNYASATKQADTLYVATGCLYANSTQYTGSASGKTVRVPTHYFKALLYKGRDAAAKDTDGYLAAGFILPHDAGIAKGNFLDYICSIDELERQTGIDFFPNLVTRVGTEMANAIEASAPGTFWK